MRSRFERESGYQLKPKKDLIAKYWLVVFWKSFEHAQCAVDFSLYVGTHPMLQSLIIRELRQITTVEFIFLISFFAGVPSAFSSEASLRPIVRDSKTRLGTIPISESIIPQQLAQNQPDDSNKEKPEEKLERLTCPLKTSESDEKKPSTPELSDRTIQVTGRTVLGEEGKTITLEEYIKKFKEDTVTPEGDLSEDPIKILEELRRVFVLRECPDIRRNNRVLHTFGLILLSKNMS